MSLFNRTHYLQALIAGALSVLAFAPFSLPIFALVSGAALYLLSHQKHPLKLGWCFGLGYFGAGVSWVYVSIHYHGGMSLIAAAVMTFLFAAGLATLFGFQIWLYRYLFKQRSAAGFIAIWLMFEWIRSWLMTGFPWLLTGYAFIDTPLSHLAPIGGVWSVSLIAISIAVFTAEAAISRQPKKLIVPLGLYSLSLFTPHDWVQETGQSRSMTLVQPNTMQQAKWDMNQVDQHIQRLINLSVQAPATDFIIWPETAIPKLINKATDQLAPLLHLLDEQNTRLISGFPRKVISDKTGQVVYHNAMGLLNGPAPLSTYDKQRLVPFGEYLPFENQLRDLIAFFSLPMSNFSLPANSQYVLKAKGIGIAGAICYEIAFPELVRHQAKDAAFILTLSNDTWFGGSHGPDQHFEMARMRALENGRPVIRATNDGITGFIDQRGQIISIAPRFETAMLTHDLVLVEGQTPYQRLGVWPTLIIITLMLSAALFRARSFKQDT